MLAVVQVCTAKIEKYTFGQARFFFCCLRCTFVPKDSIELSDQIKGDAGRSANPISKMKIRSRSNHEFAAQARPSTKYLYRIDGMTRYTFNAQGTPLSSLGGCETGKLMQAIITA